jgi:hypothetical protein
MELPSISRRSAARRLQRQTGFRDGSLTHDLLVTPGPGSRPGERLKVSSMSVTPVRVGPDGTRHDFQVLVDRHGTLLTGLCLKRIESPNAAEESAWSLVARFVQEGFDGTSEILPDEIAGERAYRYGVTLRMGRLTEWKFAHDGWLFVVGLLVRGPTRDTETAHQRARAMLASWQWTSDAAV